MKLYALDWLHGFLSIHGYQVNEVYTYLEFLLPMVSYLPGYLVSYLPGYTGLVSTWLLGFLSTFLPGYLAYTRLLHLVWCLGPLTKLHSPVCDVPWPYRNLDTGYPVILLMVTYSINIYFLGNPAIWLPSLFFLLESYLFYTSTQSEAKRKKRAKSGENKSENVIKYLFDILILYYLGKSGNRKSIGSPLYPWTIICCRIL